MEKRDICPLVEVYVENYGKEIICSCKLGRKKCIYTKRHDLFCPVMGNGKTSWRVN